MMLALAAVSLKHPGFQEEREWRIVHLPRQFPSEVVLPEPETVNGVPQKVYKLRLIDGPDYDITDFDFAALLDRVIIGPTPYHDTIATALIDALTAAGVPNPWNRIVRSNIPLRS